MNRAILKVSRFKGYDVVVFSARTILFENIFFTHDNSLDAPLAVVARWRHRTSRVMPPQHVGFAMPPSIVVILEPRISQDGAINKGEVEVALEPKIRVPILNLKKL